MKPLLVFISALVCHILRTSIIIIFNYRLLNTYKYDEYSSDFQYDIYQKPENHSLNFHYFENLKSHSDGNGWQTGCYKQ